MNKKILILPVVLLGLGLASCATSSTTDQTVSVTATKGTAAIVLAGKIAESNTTLKNTEAESATELVKGSAGAVICDAVTGLHKLVGVEDKAYGVTKMVSKNSDLLIATSAASAVPTSSSVIVSYSKGSAGDLALKKLCSSYWNVEPTFKYVSSTKDTLDVMKSSKLDGESVDFVLSPYATASTSGYELSDELVLNDVWASYTEGLENVDKQESIPGLATFVSKNVAENKATGLESFYTELNIGIDNAVDNPDRTRIVMDNYSTDRERQISMFGTTSLSFGEAQEAGANKLGLLKKAELTTFEDYLNNFLKLVDAETVDYSGCFFNN